MEGVRDMEVVAVLKRHARYRIRVQSTSVAIVRP